MTKDYNKQELIQVECKNLDVLVVITDSRASRNSFKKSHGEHL